MSDRTGAKASCADCREPTGANCADRQVLDITVLMGGPSSEREVSFMSGTMIADALGRTGHKVRRADISPDDLSALDRDGIDVVWIAMHGQFGESGELQQLCEDRALRYTGSDPRASKLGMDKSASKELFRRAGLSAPPEVVISKEDEAHAVAGRLDEIGLPAICKPVDGGSSVDVTLVHTDAQRDEAVSGLLDRYARALVEKYVEGPEVTVGILGERPLPLLQIISPGEFFDYHAKYDDDSGAVFTFDHCLDGEVVVAAQTAALQAHKVLGCRDMSRVDMIIDAAGTPQIFEINTIPGFTSHSLLPLAARQAKVSFEQLVDRIARMALQR